MKPSTVVLTFKGQLPYLDKSPVKFSILLADSTGPHVPHLESRPCGVPEKDDWIAPPSIVDTFCLLKLRYFVPCCIPKSVNVLFNSAIFISTIECDKNVITYIS